MRNRLWVFVALFLTAETGAAQDARAVLQAADRTMGASSSFMAIKTVEEMYTLSDGARTMELHYVRGLRHN